MVAASEPSGDSDVPEMNLAALEFNAKMMACIQEMRNVINRVMVATGQTWADWPGAEFVDEVIVEYGESLSFEEVDE